MLFTIQTMVLLLSTFGVAVTPPSEETTSALVKALRQHFRSDCLAIISSDLLHSQFKTTQLYRRLSKDVAITLLNGKTWFKESQKNKYCCRPLHVIPPDYDNTRLLSQLSETGHMSGAAWLLFADNLPLEEVLHGVYVPFDCVFLVAQSSGNDVQLHEVYRVAHSWPLRSERFGSWRADEGLTAPHSGLYTRRQSLEGLAIMTTNVHDPPLNTLTSVNGSLILGGFYGNIWSILEKGMNFTSVQTVPKLGRNNKYEEMFQQVVRGEAAVTSTCVGHTSQRDILADFTVPIKIIPFRIFVAQPTGRNIEWSGIFSPFSKVLWLVLLCSSFISAVLMTLLDRFYPQSEYHYTFGNSMILVLGAMFCQQGYPHSPENASCRIVFIVCFLTGIIIYNSYSATLTSYLTVNRPVWPFTNLEGLSYRKDYSLGVINMSLSHIQLQKAESGVLKLLHDRHISNSSRNTPVTYLEGFQRACADRFAFVALSEMLTVDRDPLNCSLVHLPQRFSTYTASIAMTKHSPYRGLFNHNLLKLYSSGLIGDLYKKVVNERPSSASDEVPSINLAAVEPIFSVLICGASIALVFVLLEWALFVTFNKKNNIR